MGFRMPYTLAVCFPGTTAICAQGSSTVFVVVGLGVFSLWLYVCARLVGDADVCHLTSSGWTRCVLLSLTGVHEDRLRMKVRWVDFISLAFIRHF
jgi:hypothetical protein